MPTRNQKIVGEVLGTKGRNPMESSNIKGREVAMNRREEEESKKKLRFREQKKKKKKKKWVKKKKEERT